MEIFIIQIYIEIVRFVIIYIRKQLKGEMRNAIKSTVRATRFMTMRPLFLFSTRFTTFTPSSNLFFVNKQMFGSNKPKPHQNIEKGEFVGSGFYVQQLLTGCLAIYSYYIESGNEAFLIDPLNEVAKYDALIQQRGKKLKGVFLTHYHADYIAGHLELKKKYNCQIFLGPKALETFGIKVLKDGQEIKVGDIKLKVIHTPGHTEQSSCLLLLDSKNKQQAVFTGDTIFLNEVGRPDLAVKTNLTATDLANMLFDSIQKVKKLDGDIRIYPGHGAGSACGKSIGKGDFCTLETQKKNNYALKELNKQKFVKDVLNQMPNPPQYFGYNAGINKFTPFDYKQAHSNTNIKLSSSQVKQLIKKENAFIIDCRAKSDLKQGMIKGSAAVDFDGAFANWVGTVLPPTGTYIIYGPQQRAKESIQRLLRIGYINIKGFFSQNLQSISKDVEVYKPDFAPTVKIQNRTILDVRRPSQWQQGVAEGQVKKLELNEKFIDNIKNLDKSKKYVVHCQSGYRARIGYSLLKNEGFDVKVYADGGYGDFEKIGVKIVKPTH